MSSSNHDRREERLNIERVDHLYNDGPSSSRPQAATVKDDIIEEEFEERIHHARRPAPGRPERIYLSHDRTDPGPSIRIAQRTPRRRSRSPIPYAIDPGPVHAERPPRRPHEGGRPFILLEERRRPPRTHSPPHPIRLESRRSRFDAPPQYQSVFPRRRSRSRSRHSLPHSPSPEPEARPVPEGFVKPIPLLRPRPERGHGHDLLGLASNPRPKSDPELRGKVVLCLYHNSKKSYDYRTVEYIHKRDRPIGDRALFHNMRNKYQFELRGWIRRWFSFKGLTTVRLLLYGGGQLFRPPQDDDLFSLIFMKIWWNPNQNLNRNSIKWIRWIEGEKRQHGNLDIAIELIEDYIPERVVFFIGLGLLGIVGLTSAWLIKGGDPGYVSTVMSFVLTFIAAVVALTTIWDHFDAGRAKEIKDHTTVVLPEHFQGLTTKDPWDDIGLFKQRRDEEMLKDKGKENSK